MAAKTESLDARLNIRLSADEIAHVREQADKAGLSLSDFGRRALLGRSIAAATPPINTATLNELRRLGGLVKHIAHTADRAAVNSTLAALENAARKLAS